MKHTFRIEGMGCNHCVATVQEALSRIDGVHVEEVEIGRARIEVTPGTASLDAISNAIRESGYEPASVVEGG